MTKPAITKAEIRKQALNFGAEFIGFAPAKRWGHFGDISVAGQPQTIWPQAKTVIVFGVPLWLPIVEAAPTVLGREQIIVTNKLLEKVSYLLRVLLNREGHKSFETTAHEFSNAWAGYYAGLGTLGWNHMLLTREYGPRVQLKSIFTDLELYGDAMIQEDLCKRCLYCQRICPVQALSEDAGDKFAVVNQAVCLEHEKRLQQAYCDPCGSCIKVCPVGEDRQLFQSNNFDKYFSEQKILAQNPNAEEYKDWMHIRSFGSYPLKNGHGDTK